MNQKAYFFLIAAAILLHPSPILADHQAIYADKDNTLFEEPTGSLSSGAGVSVYVGKTGGAPSMRHRTLLHFDVSTIPVSATITDVKLHMTAISQPNQPISNLVKVYPVTATWGEGTSFSPDSAGVSATVSDATWIHRFFSTSNWATPGGDYASAESAALPVLGLGEFIWDSQVTPYIVLDVQSWVNDHNQNFGWILIANENLSDQVIGFASRENAVATTRPWIDVTYNSNVDVPSQLAPIRTLRAFPNPTRQNSQISFSIPSTTRISIELLDIAGRTVQTIKNGVWMNGGEQNISWTPSRTLPSGTYFVRVRSSLGTSQVTRLTVLR